MFCFSGIGRATALALARCGAKVVAVTRTQADLNSLVQEVQQTHTHTVTHLRGFCSQPVTFHTLLCFMCLPVPLLYSKTHCMVHLLLLCLLILHFTFITSPNGRITFLGLTDLVSDVLFISVELSAVGNDNFNSKYINNNIHT